MEGKVKIMKIKNILYPELEEIQDISNCKVNVLVETSENLYLNINICTPLFYSRYMEELNLDYVPALPPYVIVRELTYNNIREALEAFCEDDGYWMKLFCISGSNKAAFSKQSLDEMMREANKWYYEEALETGII